MTTSSTRLALALSLALAVACGEGDGDDDGLDRRQAQTSWAAANHAAATAHSTFATQAVLGVHGDVEIACDDGGVLRLSGTMTHANDFDLEVTYDECVEDGVVIDGSVSMVAIVDVDVAIELHGHDETDDAREAVEGRVVVDYDGVLELEGDVEGTCVIDAQVTAHAVLFERFASAGVTVGGTVCGHEASDVIRG